MLAKLIKKALYLQPEGVSGIQISARQNTRRRGLADKKGK